jgi:prophage endopeptidase
MIPNPWLILGAVGVAIAATIGGYFYGCHVTNTARDASALKARLAATEAARDKEQGWQAALNASQAQLAKERHDAQARENKLRADIDAGARRLRIAVRQQRLPGDPEGPTGSHDTSIELAPSARAAYFDLRAGLKRDTEALKACQGYVRAIGGG